MARASISRWPASAQLAYRIAVQQGATPQQATDFAAAQYGESGFDPNARNASSGAAGLYQLLSPGYVQRANALGGVFNPEANIRAILPDYLAYYRSHPQLQPGAAAAAVERSGEPASYYARGNQRLGAAPVTQAISQTVYPATTTYTGVLGVPDKIIGTPYSGTHTLGNWESDNAVDLAAPIGTPIYAAQAGTIGPQFGSLGSSSSRFAGLRLHLKSPSDEFYYAHLSKFAPGIQPGATVTRGQLLGYSGEANGVGHLHFASESGDPRKFIGPGGREAAQPSASKSEPKAVTYARTVLAAKPAPEKPRVLPAAVRQALQVLRS